jgi:hypothetical protein
MEDNKNTEKKKKWTVLIYQAADNNLTEESIFALKEMKKLGTIGKDTSKARAKEFREVDILVQLDPGGRGNQTLRLHIGGEDPDEGELNEDNDEISKLGETDTGARKTLIDFLCFGIKKFPADYYMVILSGHGSGTDQDFFLRDENRPLSLIPSSLGVPDLGEVFAKGKDVDKALEEAKGGKNINIIGFDACLMSMAEICYQLRESVADMMIGSEGFSPNAGWPLHRILRIFKNKPDIDPKQLARIISKRYTRFYVNYELGGLSVDISVLRIERIKELEKRIEELVAVLKRKLDESLAQREGHGGQRRGKAYDFPRPPFIDAILMSHWEAQSYNGEQFVDLFDFCDILQQRYTEKVAPKDDEGVKAVKKACRDVMDAIYGKKDSVVSHSCYNGPAYQYSYGVSIYFPWSCTEFSTHYFHKDKDEAAAQEHAHIDFPKDSGWGEFLLLYFKATILRWPRGANKFTEAEVRSGPPASRGPNARVRSMRNPTPYYIDSPCIDRKDPESVDNPMENKGEKSNA